MWRRSFVLLIMLAVLIALTAKAPLSVAIAQSPTAKVTAKPAAPAPSKNGASPRTAWGDPDLQGIWSYATITPLERPTGQNGKEALTDEEAAAVDQDVQSNAERRGGTAEADLAQAYNALYYDRGKSIGRTSLIIDPADGRLPPLTPEAQQRRAALAERARAHPADSWEDLPLQLRCIIYHGVPPLPSGYNNTYQIFQTPGNVAILDENIHDVRWIPVDGRAHVGSKIRQWNGNSRGHWENDTLVVETTNYDPRTTFRGFMVSGATLRAVERFRRVAPDKIDYQFTIYDPGTYTKPFTVALPMTSLPDYVIYEYDCHEGNYAIAHVLKGARSEEKAAAGVNRSR